MAKSKSDKAVNTAVSIYPQDLKLVDTLMDYLSEQTDNLVPVNRSYAMRFALRFTANAIAEGGTHE